MISITSIFNILMMIKYKIAHIESIINKIIISLINEIIIHLVWCWLDYNKVIYKFSMEFIEVNFVIFIMKWPRFKYLPLFIVFLIIVFWLKMVLHFLKVKLMF